MSSRYVACLVNVCQVADFHLSAGCELLNPSMPSKGITAVAQQCRAYNIKHCRKYLPRAGDRQRLLFPRARHR